MNRAIPFLFSLSLTTICVHVSAESLIPAGSLIQCTVSEPRLSSKTLAVGDPVLCKVSSAERFGGSGLPYNSFMVGRFEDYRDPGHLVGRGWMELKFERMVIEPDTEIPVATKVVAVPGYPIDREGRIHGKGHPVRDTFEWTIPILWPIDLLNLPRRGPRPTLKGETRLTLKMMDDLRIPDRQPFEREPSGLIRRAPSAYELPRYQLRQRRDDTARASAAIPVPSPMLEFDAVARPPALPIPPAASLAPQVVHRMPYSGPGRAVAPHRDPVTLVYNDGRPREQVYNYILTPNTLYVLDHVHREVPVDDLDLDATERVNREAGVSFDRLDDSY